MIKSTTNNGEIEWDRWVENAKKYPDKEAIIHWVAGEEPFRWTFSSLLNAAESFAVGLKKKGVQRGDVCATVIRHNKYFYPIYLSISSIGAIPAILAYPNPRLHPDKFRHGLEGMSKSSGLDWILTEKAISEVIEPLVTKENSTIRGIFFPLEWEKDLKFEGKELELINEVRAKIKNTDPALLQHSSGTTGLQKPVLLSHKAVLDFVTNYGKALELSPKDKIISWLPLYHDMGLIAAFHLPLAFGIPVVQMDTFEWIMIPSLLMEVISKEKGTLTWQPNFAYNILAEKVHEDDLEGISLDSMRMFINCSEPVRDRSNKLFYNRYKKYGVKENSLSSSFGMAEVTFLATQSPPGEILKKLNVNRQKLSQGIVEIIEGEENTRDCVSSGKVIDGCEITIIDEEGNEVKEGYVGELLIKSVSLFDGYRNYPEKTAAVLKKGWYYSGDYGFCHEGYYYIIGRKKDIIIVAGNNVYPEDVEDLVSHVKGVVPGRVVAFGEYDEEIGSEQISVVAETKIIEEEGRKKLKLDIIIAGMTEDINIKKVYLVPSRWLIKSSAGKPSRKTNRERLVEKKESIKWS
ncbi:MAG: AMP-binding protein [Bacteroidetes bacterium]|nr:AMP-binding protein [Bacteroidota bacterium]